MRMKFKFNELFMKINDIFFLTLTTHNFFFERYFFFTYRNIIFYYTF